jgi:hypothetical protein
MFNQYQLTMKKISPVFAVMLIMTAVLMVSCDKDETATSLSVNLLKKATIKGYAYAQLDLTNEGLEKAPAGTMVIISIPYSNLNSSASGTYKDTATVNTDGFFEIEVPVGNNSATVTYIPLPFETNQIQSLGSFDSQVKKYYTGQASSITLGANAYDIIEIQYIANDYADYVEMAQISGNLLAETNDTIPGSEKTTAGIVLVFHGDGWNKTVNTTDEGAYTVTVPANQSVYVDYSFTAQNIVLIPPSIKYLPVLYIYKEESKYVGNFSGTTVDNVDIDAGYGEIVE